MVKVAMRGRELNRWGDEPTVVLGRTATTPYGKNEWWWPSGPAA